MAHDPRLEALFQSLGRALSERDLAAVADCWAVPALVLSDDGAVPFTERSQIEGLFEGAVKAHRDRGITATEPEVIGVQPFTDRLFAAEVRWPYLDAGGERHGDESSHYLVWIDDDGRPRIRVALSLSGG